MKIFYLITELDPGGAERMLLETVRGVQAAGHDVAVGCLLGEGKIADWLRRARISVHGCLMRYPGDPGAVFRVGRLVREYRPDLVHTYLFHANQVGRWAALLAGRPPVISAIRVFDDRWSHHLLDRVTLRLVKRVTVNSRVVGERLVTEKGYPRAKIEYIPNGVALQEAGAMPSDIVIPEKRQIVVTAGRQHQQKGLDVLLRAIPIIRETADAHFLIAGREDLATAQLRQVIEELDIREYVTFLGFRHDVRDIVANADLFVLPSRWEGMPNVLLEAMAARVAVVASAVDGCRDIVADSATGTLVEPDNVAALAAAVKELLRDGERRRAMGAAAAAWVEREFTLDRMVERTLELYRRTVAEVR